MAIYNPIDSYLTEQLESIFNQTFSIDELLIIDDKSTQENGLNEILFKLEHKNPSIKKIDIKLIRNENNIGHTKSFVTHLNKIKSRFIFFSDQDDVWDPKKIATCLSYFKTHSDCYILTHNFYICDGDLNAQSKTALEQEKYRNSSIGHGFATAVRSITVPVLGCATDSRGGHDGWIRFIGDFFQIREVIDQPLAYWRRHNSTHGALQKKSAHNLMQKIKNKINHLSHQFRLSAYQHDLTVYEDLCKCYHILLKEKNINTNKMLAAEIKLRKLKAEIEIRGILLMNDYKYINIKHIDLLFRRTIILDCLASIYFYIKSLFNIKIHCK